MIGLMYTYFLLGRGTVLAYLDEYGKRAGDAYLFRILPGLVLLQVLYVATCLVLALLRIPSIYYPG